MNLNPIAGVISGVGDIIGKFKASPEEKAAATQALFELQMAGEQQLLEYETKRLGEQAKTIRAEVGSESWLAGNWRPITMLTFTALVVCHWLGLTPDDLPDEQVDQLMQIVQIGLGGYVVGRSAEKIARVVKQTGTQS